MPSTARTQLFQLTVSKGSSGESCPCRLLICDTRGNVRGAALLNLLRPPALVEKGSRRILGVQRERECDYVGYELEMGIIDALPPQWCCIAFAGVYGEGLSAKLRWSCNTDFSTQSRPQFFFSHATSKALPPRNERFASTCVCQHTHEPCGEHVEVK